MMILILGGSGSGKSAYAEDYLLRTAGDKKKYYIATMQIWDEEMQAKVARHHSCLLYTSPSPRDA